MSEHNRGSAFEKSGSKQLIQLGADRRDLGAYAFDHNDLSGSFQTVSRLDHTHKTGEQPRHHLPRTIAGLHGFQLDFHFLPGKHLLHIRHDRGGKSGVGIERGTCQRMTVSLRTQGAQKHGNIAESHHIKFRAAGQFLPVDVGNQILRTDSSAGAEDQIVFHIAPRRLKIFHPQLHRDGGIGAFGKSFRFQRGGGVNLDLQPRSPQKCDPGIKVFWLWIGCRRDHGDRLDVCRVNTRVIDALPLDSEGFRVCLFRRTGQRKSKKRTHTCQQNFFHNGITFPDNLLLFVYGNIYSPGKKSNSNDFFAISEKFPFNT